MLFVPPCVRRPAARGLQAIDLPWHQKTLMQPSPFSAHQVCEDFLLRYADVSISSQI